MPSPDPITLTVAIIGAATGLTGAILGVLNAWHQYNNEKVKLRVIPMQADLNDKYVITSANSLDPTEPCQTKEGVEILCIEVTNLSVFEVTISDVGFGKMDAPLRAAIGPVLVDGRKLPVRLKAHDSITVYAPPGMKLDPRCISKPVAYASTACGYIAYGRSPFFSKYMKRMRDLP